MKRIAIFLAVTSILIAGPSLAQNPPAQSGPNNSAVNSKDQNNSNAPVAGRNSFTEGQAKGRIEDRGYTIPRSHDNPELLWIDDPEVIRDLIAVSAPVPGHIVAHKVQHCDAEVLEGAIALVVGGMSVHQPP